MEAHAFGTALMHPHTLSTYPKAPRIGTIPGPTWDPRTVHAVPHPIQVGPMYYSDGPTIQNIFNYLHIKIITKLCILHSHVVVLLLFSFGFPSVNSQNIFELFIHFYFFSY